METDAIKARICHRILNGERGKRIMSETMEDCGGNKTRATGLILEVTNDMATNPDLLPSDYYAYQNLSLKSCNYCKNCNDCPAKHKLKNKLIHELEFIDRLRLLSSTKFWQAIAENCNRYVLQKG